MRISFQALCHLRLLFLVQHQPTDAAIEGALITTKNALTI